MDEAGVGLIALLLLLFAGGGKKKKKKKDPNKPDKPDKPKDVPPRKPKLPAIVDTYPTPASFYPVEGGDNGYGIAFRLLRTAGFLAAKQFGKLDDAGANDFGKQVAKGIQRQVRTWKAIQCNGWNDATATTWGWKKPKSVPAEHGRAIRLLRAHPDQLERLADNKPALRTMKWGKPSMKGEGGSHRVSDEYQNFPTLWMPGIKLKELWESDGKTVNFGGPWPDQNASKKLPPPWILKLGVKFAQGANPGQKTYGCMGMEWTP